MSTAKIPPLLLVGITEIDGRIIHLDSGLLDGSPAPEPAYLRMPIWACAWCAHDSDSPLRIQNAVASAAANGFAYLRTTCSVRDGAPLPFHLQFRLTEIGAAPVILVVGVSEESHADGEAAFAAANRLLYAASHDLQDPMRMILIYAQLLQRRYGDQLDEEGRRVLGFVADGARRMTDLLRSLLTYARLEVAQPDVPRLEAGPIESAAAFSEALSNLRVPIEETNAEIAAVDLPAVLAQQWEVVLVFQNLLSNAIKYSKPTVSPRISVGALRDGDYWRFSITDQGLGFPPEQAPALFDLFTRLHSQTSGTGLGLSICKRILARRGGRIWAESCPNVGSTFYFTLRAASARAAGPSL